MTVGLITTTLAAGTGGVATVRNTDAALLLFESASFTNTSAYNETGGVYGATTVNASASLFDNGAGRSTVVGGNNAIAGSGTVYGGTGSVTVFGGRNVVFGGNAGGNLIVSTVGDTMVGGGSGDLLVGNGSGDLIVAGAGNETLSSAGETGGTGALLYGSSGADLIAAGAFFDTIVAGSGATTISGGSADPNVIYAGSGTDVIVTGGRGDFVQAGTGNASIFTAQGANVVTFVNGGAGGSDVISSFKVGTDQIALRGYAGSGTMAGITSSQVTGGSTVLTLADNTRITLQGVTNLGASSFV